VNASEIWQRPVVAQILIVSSYYRVNAYVQFTSHVFMTHNLELVSIIAGRVIAVFYYNLI